MKKLLTMTAAVFMMSIASFKSTAAIAIFAKPVLENLKRDIPPPAVVSGFIALFGNVPVMQWKARSNGQWRAHFLRNGIPWEATFTGTGVLVKSERA